MYEAVFTVLPDICTPPEMASLLSPLTRDSLSGKPLWHRTCWRSASGRSGSYATVAGPRKRKHRL
jgi:hypothetical protein